MKSFTVRGLFLFLYCFCCIHFRKSGWIYRKLVFSFCGFCYHKKSFDIVMGAFFCLIDDLVLELSRLSVSVCLTSCSLFACMSFCGCFCFVSVPSLFLFSQLPLTFCILVCQLQNVLLDTVNKLSFCFQSSF